MAETITTVPVAEQEYALRLGATLREKRIAMGLSVADVAAQIRLAPRQIEALEADDMAHLPELPFVRGFVRSYAKLLHLDEQPLLATLPDPHAVSGRIEPEFVGVPFNMQKLSSRQNRIWLYATALIALIAIVFVLWHFATPKAVGKAPASDVMESTIALPPEALPESAVPESDTSADQPGSAVAASVSPAVVELPVLKSATTLVQSAKPAEVTKEKVPAAQLAPTRLRIVFDAESWTEIKDATGRLMSSKLNLAGSELNLNGQAPYELVIGNARFVRLYRRGKQVDLDKYINSTSEVARLTLE
jgi:cytoskeleton protein RodZ